ncbi:hypothetical protein AiwAL_05435 [Acidiphilium sp. AL]|uniref:hypothetical protein n=1 Tax=Acidiphilium sp. AL TaxID=2871704 RepID=UPI0021CB016B|nr:hypothetical protein [Acidiphilium sp. AL]MCU4159544.1 hypothetical protein [Acidiphilium sp. AL]
MDKSVGSSGDDMLSDWRPRFDTAANPQILAEWVRRLNLPGAEQVQGLPQAYFTSHESISSSATTIEINVSNGISMSSSEFIRIIQNKTYVTVSCSSRALVDDLTLPDFNMAWSEASDATTPFAIFRAKICAWSRLEIDWDGEDGVVPSSVVITHALDFIDVLEKSWMPVPSIYIAGDGEVGFRWTNNNARASVSFLDDGHIVGFCPEYCGLPAVEVDTPYISSQPNPLVTRLLASIRVRFG